MRGEGASELQFCLGDYLFWLIWIAQKVTFAWPHAIMRWNVPFLVVFKKNSPSIRTSCQKWLQNTSFSNGFPPFRGGTQIDWVNGMVEFVNWKAKTNHVPEHSHSGNCLLWWWNCRIGGEIADLVVKLPLWWWNCPFDGETVDGNKTRFWPRTGWFSVFWISESSWLCRDSACSLP